MELLHIVSGIFSQHSDEHHAERRELHEVLHERAQDPVEAVGGEQRDRLHGNADRLPERLARSRINPLVRDGLLDGPVEARRQLREQRDEHGSDQEERGGIGQGVADPLDAIEEPRASPARRAHPSSLEARGSVGPDSI